MKYEEETKVGASRIEHTANEQFLPTDEAVHSKLKATEQKNRQQSGYLVAKILLL